MLFGRDLRVMSALQQRLMNAQQSMERDYSRLRDVEMRYRLLFQLSSEAVLILDPARSRVTEANPAARGLVGEGADDMPRAADAVLSMPSLRAVARSSVQPCSTPSSTILRALVAKPSASKGRDEG